MDEYDVLCGYVPSFVQHLKDTSARLGLRIGSHASEDQINIGSDTEEDTEVDTHTNWTPAECDAFFRAVSVHSRWRPDLIAACIPTRTEWEVWMYLEALEDGAATLAVQQDEDMDMEDGLVDERRDVEMQVDSGFHSGSDVDEDEDLCEPALEVSQVWIDAEETMASWIIDEEHLACEGETASDTGEVDDKPPMRKRGRPRGTRKRGAQSWIPGQTVSNNASPSHPVCASPSPEPASQCKPCRDHSTLLARKRQVLMRCLELPHLLVLDSILREGEEAMKESSSSREGSVTVAIPSKHGGIGAPRARDGDMSGLSDQITGPQGAAHVSQSSSTVVIDPVLLALSGGTDPAERQSDQGLNETGCSPVQAPDPVPSTSTQPTSLEVLSQLTTGNTSPFPPDQVAFVHLDATTNAKSEPSLFSPRSRRRIQKRLYMRRKRALLRGDATAPASVVDMGTGKLKPGKRTKSEQSKVSVVSTPVPSDPEVELLENVSKKNKPGLTLSYKLKAQFAEMGIDAAYLREQGIDLLNLGTLGKLMGLYSSLEHSEEDGSTLPQSIDARSIRYLQAAMVLFVTDLIHRAIVMKERETRLKQRSRAWRHGDQITIGTVEHAVEAIGARYHSHKAYFKSLEAFDGLFVEASSAAANATEPNPDASVDPDVGAADQSADPPGLSLHRNVYTPLVCPPSAWRTSPLACLAHKYEQEATRTRRGMSVNVEEGELMSDETDEEALEQELKEEDEADVWDMQLALTHEHELWDTIRRK